MQPMTIVEHRNILQYILLRCIASWLVLPLDSFLFKAAEKTFCYSIIETVAGTAHATN